MSDLNTKDLTKGILTELKKICKTKVVLDEVTDENSNYISVSRTKLSEIVKEYVKIYELANKCWSNLPPPPCSELTYVFIWMMISDEYDFNHNTVTWEGSNANTFVHLWSIMDRLKQSLEDTGLYWIVGDRSCTGYYMHTGLTGPMDEKMYIPEVEPLPYIDEMDDEIFSPTYTEQCEEFCSYLDFCTSVKNSMTSTDCSLDNAYIAMQMRDLERAWRSSEN